MEDQPCIVCGSFSHDLLYEDVRDYEYGVSTEPRSLKRCTDCGLLYLSPMPTPQELDGFYPDDYANIHEEQVWLHAFLMDRYYGTLHSMLKRELPQRANIIDVGCAAGHLIGFLQDQEPDWTMMGVDMNPAACEVAASKGRNVVQGMFETVEVDESSFDLIMLNHIIEHSLDPAAMLAKAFSLLKPGGMLYLETPNTKSAELKFFKKYWGGLHYPRHTYLFSPVNIERFLIDNGFNEFKFGYTLNMFGWALSLQNVLVDKFKLRVRNGRISLYPYLMLAMSPLVFAQKLLSNSAGMRVIAIKR